MAAAYNGTGDTARALELEARSLKIRERALGPKHPEVGQALGNLGAMQVMRGQMDEGVASLERAVAIYEQPGVDQPINLVYVLNNLASTYSGLSRGDLALATQQRAMDLLDATKDPPQRLAAHSSKNLGQLLGEVERYDEADVALRRAQTTFTELFGAEHQAVAEVLDQRAALAHANGDDTRSIELADRAVEMYRATVGNDHPELVTALEKAGEFRIARGEVESGFELLRDALRIGKLQGAGSSLHGRAAVTLAGAAADVGKCEEFRAELAPIVVRLEADELDLGPWLESKAYFTLARCSLDSRRARIDARAHASKAAKILDTMPAPPPGRVEAVRAWLAAHPVPAGGN